MCACAGQAQDGKRIAHAYVQDRHSTAKPVFPKGDAKVRVLGAVHDLYAANRRAARLVLDAVRCGISRRGLLLTLSQAAHANKMLKKQLVMMRSTSRIPKAYVRGAFPVPA